MAYIVANSVMQGVDPVQLVAGDDTYDFSGISNWSGAQVKWSAVTDKTAKGVYVNLSNAPIEINGYAVGSYQISDPYGGTDNVVVNGKTPPDLTFWSGVGDDYVTFNGNYVTSLIWNISPGSGNDTVIGGGALATIDLWNFNDLKFTLGGDAGFIDLGNNSSVSYENVNRWRLWSGSYSVQTSANDEAIDVWGSSVKLDLQAGGADTIHFPLWQKSSITVTGISADDALEFAKTVDLSSIVLSYNEPANTTSLTIKKSSSELAQVILEGRLAISQVEETGNDYRLHFSATDNAAPVGSVSISGTAQVGKTLSATQKLVDADGLGTVKYSWYASGSSAVIGTGASLTLAQAQSGKTITVVASYEDGRGAIENVSSDATSAVISNGTSGSGGTSSGGATSATSLKISSVLATSVPLYESGTSKGVIGFYQVGTGATYASQANLKVGATLPAESDSVPQALILNANGGAWKPTAGAKIVGVDGSSSGGYILEGVVSSKGYSSLASWTMQDVASGSGVQAQSTTAQKLSASQVTSYETMFNQDLNGDGSIGAVTNTVTVKSVGDEFIFIGTDGQSDSVSSYLGTDNYYYSSRTGLTLGSDLSDANKALTSTGKAWTPVTGTKTLVVKQTSLSGGYAIVGSGVNAQTGVYTKFGQIEYTTNSANNSHTLKTATPKSISVASVLSLEGELGVDINGDGAIGTSVSEVVFAGSAGKSIYSTADGGYVIADAGLSEGDSLPSGSTPITVTGTKGFASQLQGEITGVAELSSGGYDLVSAKQVGQKPIYYSTLISDKGVAGKSTTLSTDKLFANERSYQQDLNGDGAIGDAVFEVTFAAEEVGGIWSLYQMSAGGYLIAEAGLTQGDAPTTGVSLRVGSKAWVPTTGSEVVGIGETEQGSYELLTRLIKGSTVSYSASVINPETGSVGKATVLTLAQVYAKEMAYEMDLTGEGDIGDVIEEVVADNGTTGVYKMSSGAYAVGDSGYVEGESTSAAVLMSGKAQWALGKNQTVEGAAVSEDGSKVSLLLETTSNMKITAAEQTFSAQSGLAVGKAVALSKPAQLQAAEVKYQVDISGDGYTGVVTDGKQAQVWDDGAGHVYALYKTPQTWANADKAAKALGGTLAVLTDESMSLDFYLSVDAEVDGTEYKKTAAVDGGGAAYVWTAGAFNAAQKSWQWSDGSNADVDLSGDTGVNVNDPTTGSKNLALALEDWEIAGNYAESGTAGQWNDLAGTDKLFYVVEWTIA